MTRRLQWLSYCLAALSGCMAAAPDEETSSRALVERYTLFDPAAAPDSAAVLDPDQSSVLLGVRFRSDVPARVNAVRFYRDPSRPGDIDRVFVYAGDGRLIGRGSWVGDAGRPTGWVTYYVYAAGASNGTPVSIEPDTDYVVAYEAPRGGYTVTTEYFTAPRRRGILSTPADAGVYVYTAANQISPPMPTSTYAGSNYWVEPVVEVDRPDPGCEVVATAQTLWGTCVVPRTAQSSDLSPVTLGVRFTPKVDGEIRGVRLFRGPFNTFPAGGYSTAIWSAAGQRLASGAARISQNPSNGWLTAPLDRAVQVVAGQEYVATYFAPSGGYAITDGGLAAPRETGALAAPAGGGVYAYGDSESFPTASYGDSHYFVDVIFVPAAR